MSGTSMTGGTRSPGEALGCAAEDLRWFAIDAMSASLPLLDRLVIIGGVVEPRHAGSTGS